MKIVIFHSPSCRSKAEWIRFFFCRIQKQVLCWSLFNEDWRFLALKKASSVRQYDTCTIYQLHNSVLWETDWTNLWINSYTFAIEMLFFITVGYIDTSVVFCFLSHLECPHHGENNNQKEKREDTRVPSRNGGGGYAKVPLRSDLCNMNDIVEVSDKTAWTRALNVCLSLSHTRTHARTHARTHTHHVFFGRRRHSCSSYPMMKRRLKQQQGVSPWGLTDVRMRRNTAGRTDKSTETFWTSWGKTYYKKWNI